MSAEVWLYDVLWVFPGLPYVEVTEALAGGPLDRWPHRNCACGITHPDPRQRTGWRIVSEVLNPLPVEPFCVGAFAAEQADRRVDAQRALAERRAAIRARMRGTCPERPGGRIPGDAV